jgi:cytochrome c551/c552
MQRCIILVLVMLAGCGTIAQPMPKVRATSDQPPTFGQASIDTVSSPPTQVATGDPELGEQLFNTFQPVAGIACSTCHQTDSDERLIGPGMLNIASHAGRRVEGQDAAEYLRLSIVDPGAYIVEGYPDIMPRNWGQVFNDEEISHIIAYLLSLD